MIDHYKDVLVDLGEAVEGEDDEQAEERKEVERLLKKAEKSIDPLDNFHSEITKYWSAMIQRVLGHIVHSPPISVGTGRNRYTEDWALIELHGEKIDWNNFKGNVIDLGTFRTIALRSSSLIIISRNQNLHPRFRKKDVPSLAP